jgi:signal transduction histidine kinase
MNTAKSSIASSNLHDTLGTTTKRFITPLVLKIVAAFGLLVGLLVILTTITLYNLSQGQEASRKALDLQTSALVSQRLQQAIVNERISVLTTVYTDQPDSNLISFQRSFEEAVTDLARYGLDTTPLITAHNQLTRLYNAIISAVQNEQATEAHALWQTTAVPSQNLTDLIEDQLTTANNAAMEAASRTNRLHRDAVFGTIWLALLLFVVISLLGFFVLMRVVKPLRQLNQNLHQLLWNQTEHLTDQLNQSQTEINMTDEMMTIVRHDLKAPFSSIRSLAELSTILYPDMEDGVKENFERIIEMTDTSVNIISAALTRHVRHLELQPVKLGPLINKVLQLSDLRYYNVQSRIEAEEWIMDPRLMEHALLNLLSNARKFSESDIKIGVREVPHPTRATVEELELWVWNDGAVISPEDRAEIFKPGRQAAAGQKAGGHGLGLYIVKAIAERHHGRVTVESFDKAGTTFRIFIPALIAFNPIPLSDVAPIAAADPQPYMVY